MTINAAGIEVDCLKCAARLILTPTNKQGWTKKEIEEGKGEILDFKIPHDQLDGFVNNRKEHFKFQFQHVFPPESQQDEIFEAVARPVVDR